jgi:hypothetical protein
VSNSATVDRYLHPDEAWDRIVDLRNCAYLMILDGNVWTGINPLAVIASRGLLDSVTTERFKTMWDNELDRFNRERLTKIPPNCETGIEGK